MHAMIQPNRQILSINNNSLNRKQKSIQSNYNEKPNQISEQQLQHQASYVHSIKGGFSDDRNYSICQISHLDVEQLLLLIGKQFVQLKFITDLYHTIQQISQYVPFTLKEYFNHYQLQIVCLLYKQDLTADKEYLWFQIKSMQQKISQLIKMFHQTLSKFYKQDEINGYLQKIVQQNINKYCKYSINEVIIDKKNYQDFLQNARQYFINLLKDIQSYEWIRKSIQKWILESYKFQYQHRLNQMGLGGGEGSQVNKVMMQSQNSQTVKGQNLIKKQQYLVIQTNSQNLKLLDNALTCEFIQSGMIKQPHLSLPCCIGFFYKFSLIRSNRFMHTQRLDHMVMLTFQNKKLSVNDQQVKQAICALMNCGGGYIFIGMQKTSTYYTPNYQTGMSKSQVTNFQQKLKTITKTTFPTLENLKSRIEISHIPVADSDNIGGNLKYKKQGYFVIRIKVTPQPINQIRPWFIGDKLYKIDRQNERAVQVKDNLNEKDTIYKKLREITWNYGFVHTSDKTSTNIFLNRFNNTKVNYHFGTCIQPEGGEMLVVQQKSRTITNDDQAKNDNQVMNVSTGKGQKTMNTSIKQPLGTDTNPISDNTKMAQSKRLNVIQGGQDDSQQFKHVNLIVLQSKTIKTSCQQYLQKQKVQFKIQKLDTNLKKLAKQTYLIWHHKKYDDMSTYLSQFRKSMNNNKKVILISAQKSVALEYPLSVEQLENIVTLWKQQNKRAQNQLIEYAEQGRQSKQKKLCTYIRTKQKIGGIYLYFILSELGIKNPKMKNVPSTLQNVMKPIQEVIKEKHIQKQQKQKRYNNNGYNNGGKDSSKGYSSQQRNYNNQQQQYQNNNNNNNYQQNQNYVKQQQYVPNNMNPVVYQNNNNVIYLYEYLQSPGYYFDALNQFYYFDSNSKLRYYPTEVECYNKFVIVSQPFVQNLQYNLTYQDSTLNSQQNHPQQKQSQVNQKNSEYDLSNNNISQYDQDRAKEDIQYSRSFK